VRDARRDAVDRDHGVARALVELVEQLGDEGGLQQRVGAARAARQPGLPALDRIPVELGEDPQQQRGGRGRRLAGDDHPAPRRVAALVRGVREQRGLAAAVGAEHERVAPVVGRGEQLPRLARAVDEPLLIGARGAEGTERRHR
jgi:hypothetical protein